MTASLTLRPGEYCDIAIGQVHRLANLTDSPVRDCGSTVSVVIWVRTISCVSRTTTAATETQPLLIFKI